MQKRALGYALTILGIITIFLKPITNITGFSVASESIDFIGNIWFFVSGIGMIMAGGLMMTRVENEESYGGLEKTISTKVKPGKGIKGEYIPLKEILKRGTLVSNKVNVNVRGEGIYRDGRPVQGLKIENGKVEFTGYHFTDSTAARIIEQDQGLEIKNYLDPYIYLLEAMSYSGMDEKEIRHMIGSSSAEEALSLRIRYPIEKVYLKFNKNRPTHYAIEGNVEIEDMVPIKGEYIRRKRLKEL